MSYYFVRVLYLAEVHSDPEVANLERPLLRQEHIGGLDVQVHEVVRVDVVQPEHEVRDEAPDLLLRDAGVRVQVLLQPVVGVRARVGPESVRGTKP